MKAVFFDLDNTLFGTTLLVVKARKAAINAMIKEGFPEKNPVKLYSALEKIVEKRGPNHSAHYDELCKQYKVREPYHYVAAAVIAYHKVKVGKLELFPHAKQVLKKLKAGRFKLFLITEGNPVKQWEKILRLGIKNYFKEIKIIESGKTKVINQLVKKYKLQISWLVGDSLSSDIYSANKAGIISVRILKGRHKDDIPKNKFQKADYEIKEIKEIIKVLHHARHSTHTRRHSTRTHISTALIS